MGLADISAKGSEIYLRIAKDLIEAEKEKETLTTINSIIGLWEKMIKILVTSPQSRFSEYTYYAHGYPSKLCT